MPQEWQIIAHNDGGFAVCHSVARLFIRRAIVAVIGVEVLRVICEISPRKDAWRFSVSVFLRIGVRGIGGSVDHVGLLVRVHEAAGPTVRRGVGIKLFPTIGYLQILLLKEEKKGKREGEG